MVTIDPETAEFASLSHKYSGEIERAKKEGKKPEAGQATRQARWPLVLVNAYVREQAP